MGGRGPASGGSATLVRRTLTIRTSSVGASTITLNFSDGRDYQGLFLSSFGTSPRLASLAGTAADAGVNQGEFAALDAEVTAAINRWSEFAGGAGLPDVQRDHATAVHQGISTSLETEPMAKRTKRPKLW